MALSVEEKIVNKIERTYDRFLTLTVKKIKREVLSSFQKLRRLQNADKFGMIDCISCGKKDHYKKMDGGHYIPSDKYTYLAFDSDNVWGQCKYCNDYLSGNLTSYRERLINRIGAARVVRLEMLKYVEIKFSAFEYATMKVDFSEKVRELENVINRKDS